MQRRSGRRSLPVSPYSKIASALTLRQRELLFYVWAGESDQRVAAELALSEAELLGEMAVMGEIAEANGWPDLLKPLRASCCAYDDTGIAPLSAQARSARVLAADDQPLCRLGLQDLLGPLGVELEMAVDGADALRKVQAGRPFDLILMDIDMPVMDGLAAVSAIRAHERGRQIAPALIAMLTGHISPDDRRAAWAAGANTHLAKPLDPNHLRAIVDGVTRAVAG
jgi:CheY-like chemotaxis protein